MVVSRGGKKPSARGELSFVREKCKSAVRARFLKETATFPPGSLLVVSRILLKNKPIPCTSDVSDVAMIFRTDELLTASLP